MKRNVLDRLDSWAGENPDQLLYSFLDLGGNETESYTYASFVRRSNAIADHLISDYGFRAGDRLLLVYPPGLEMICAFFGCVRAGLAPVPVYPPGSYGFQAALYKMRYIAADCGASAALTSGEYHGSIARNLEKSDIDPESLRYVSTLRWIVTEDFREPIRNVTYPSYSELLFLQYTSGSTSHPKGVMVSHENIVHNCDRVVDHRAISVSWLPQYHDMGLIGYYIFFALTGGTTYGFSPTDFIQRPALWLETIKKYRASATSAPNFAYEYCLRPGRISKETMENADLSSLRFLMTAAEPVKPDTYFRFLRVFEPCGLNPVSFFAAFGLAENTLAVSNYGRTFLSVNKNALALGKVRVTAEASEIVSSRQIMSCGAPLGDISVRIVDPEKHIALSGGDVGEIWVGGTSKCLGYWQQPELTRETFEATIVGENHGIEYLRTGDLGFLYKGELFVCGRTKDMIIVRGQNYYPQDIEAVVERASGLVRPSGVVAFEMNGNQSSALAVIAEVRNRRAIPDAREIAAAIRNFINVETGLIAFVAPKSIPKTSSGKLMRRATKQMWQDGAFEILSQVSREKDPDLIGASEDTVSPFENLKARYNLSGDEDYSLAHAGVDSIDLVVFMHEIKELLKEKGAAQLASQVDIRLIQQITIAQLFGLAREFERSAGTAVRQVRHFLDRFGAEYRERELQMMREDAKMIFRAPRASHRNGFGKPGGTLLTGATGFVGPFLLKSLLEQTDEPIYALVRAPDESSAQERIRLALESIGPLTGEFERVFRERVIPVCGNLGELDLGLTRDRWTDLAGRVGTIYHNGAAVNYLFNYEKMRAANVTGTNEILKLAFHCHPKTLNYVSTTFIFGWAVKEVLYETDSNHDMELLDFGYSQSKWVAEQVVMDAMRQGLPGRIFRPALVSPSVTGGGNNLDIAIRLIAFMVNHGIGVDTFNQVSFVPADVAANNIVAVSNLPDTVNSTYHVTRDEYANMVDVTDIIAKITGREFELFKLQDFVPEVIRRCTKADPLFPLLDFLIGSIDSIASMEFKRYDSSGYRRARDRSVWGMPDPSQEETVAGILRFMRRKKLISVGPAATEAAPLMRRAAFAAGQRSL